MIESVFAPLVEKALSLQCVFDPCEIFLVTRDATGLVHRLPALRLCVSVNAIPYGSGAVFLRGKSRRDQERGGNRWHDKSLDHVFLAEAHHANSGFGCCGPEFTLGYWPDFGA